MASDFETFMKERIKDFRRISAWSKGEASVHELYSEAWLLADKIGKRQKREFDFTEPEDQDYILGALVNEYVKWGDPVRKYSRSLDREYEFDDGEHGDSLADRLSADETFDPLALLELRESLAQEDAALVFTYSQATAYVVALTQFDDDREKMCNWLAIADSTLSSRLRRAFAIVRRQSSLFDGVETVADDFMPLPGRHCLLQPQTALQQSQMPLAF